MLTTAPARSARQTSSRIVRSSNRTVSPSREISPDAGFADHAPILIVFAVTAPIPESILPGLKTIAAEACEQISRFQNYSERFRSFSRERGTLREFSAF